MTHPTTPPAPKPRAGRRLSATAAAILGLTLAATGCGSSKQADPSTTTTTVAAGSAPAVTGLTTMHVAQAGATVLVDNQHEPVYMFLPDAKSRVTCTGLCAASWPPVYEHHTKPSTSGRVRASLVGSDKDPTGGRVVTYDGWPLYTYDDDTQPGLAAGQGVNLDGGYWYLMLPDGKPLVPNGLPKPTEGTHQGS